MPNIILLLPHIKRVLFLRPVAAFSSTAPTHTEYHLTLNPESAIGQIGDTGGCGEGGAATGCTSGAVQG